MNSILGAAKELGTLVLDCCISRPILEWNNERSVAPMLSYAPKYLKNTHFNQSCATIHDWVFLVEMSEISLFYHRKMGLF